VVDDDGVRDDVASAVVVDAALARAAAPAAAAAAETAAERCWTTGLRPRPDRSGGASLGDTFVAARFFPAALDVGRDAGVDDDGALRAGRCVTVRLATAFFAPGRRPPTSVGDAEGEADAGAADDDAGEADDDAGAADDDAGEADDDAGEADDDAGGAAREA
jgi:hypothetical protein